jgi:hypothetical protein
VIAETIPAHPSASQSASVAHPGRASLEYHEWSRQVSPWKYPLDPCNLYYPTFTSNPPPNVRQQRGSQGRTSLYGILYILHSALWPASVWLRASAPGPPAQRSSMLDADSRPRPASVRRSLCSRSEVQRSPRGPISPDQQCPQHAPAVESFFFLGPRRHRGIVLLTVTDVPTESFSPSVAPAAPSSGPQNHDTHHPCAQYAILPAFCILRHFTSHQHIHHALLCDHCH